MKRLIAVCLVLGVFCACATTANYKKAVNSWVGADAAVLVTSWGYPSKTFEAPDGNTVYEYSNSETYTTSRITTYQYSPQTGSGSAVTYGGNKVNFSCDTYFEVNKDKKVVKASFNGNSCKATRKKEAAQGSGR